MQVCNQTMRGHNIFFLLNKKYNGVTISQQPKDVLAMKLGKKQRKRPSIKFQCPRGLGGFCSFRPTREKSGFSCCFWFVTSYNLLRKQKNSHNYWNNSSYGKLWIVEVKWWVYTLTIHSSHMTSCNKNCEIFCVITLLLIYSSAALLFHPNHGGATLPLW